MKVLGIETSCDETGVAVFDTGAGLLAHRLFSQVDLHAAYGGVVPELASRDHVRRLPALVDDVLQATPGGAAGLDGVAYTAGPGLVGALLVGAAFARSLAYGWNKPAVAVHHMEGHLLAPLLESPAPPFPFLALLVSGGHSMLVDVAGLGRYTVLGTTLDDAAGEAFDKVARYLGLGYPGGPIVDRLARQGDPQAIRFPRGLIDDGLDFSFSGMKTAVINYVRRHPEASNDDLCAGFQEAVVDVLVTKA
ncbi:MAG: tRNA (adenosine(37)-N6)-threonylcarbamoyltransferase complex transferase subunit TsaD, partial [Pseudomonadota bacterium]